MISNIGLGDATMIYVDRAYAIPVISKIINVAHAYNAFVNGFFIVAQKGLVIFQGRKYCTENTE